MGRNGTKRNGTERDGTGQCFFLHLVDVAFLVFLLWIMYREKNKTWKQIFLVQQGNKAKKKMHVRIVTSSRNQNTHTLRKKIKNIPVFKDTKTT